MTTHTLKCWPTYFQAVASGDKPFELRKNDRDYRVGDELVLCEWSPEQYDKAFQRYAHIENDMDVAHFRAEEDAYTGARCWCKVSYVLGGEPWLKPGYVALGLREVITNAHR